MFTVCPKCALTLVVTAADLRVAQGYVRCGRCLNVFNALARLSEERPSGAPPQPQSHEAAAAAPPEQAAAPAQPSAPSPRDEDSIEDTGEIDIELDASILLTTARDPSVPAELPAETLEGTPEETPQEMAEGMPEETLEHTVEEKPAASEAAGEPPGGARGEEIATPERLEAAERVPAAGPAAAPAQAPAAMPHQEPRVAAPADAPDAQQTNTVQQSAESSFELEGHRPRAGLAWMLGAGALTLALVLQVVNHYRDALAANPALSGALTTVYSALGVKLAPHWNIHAYDVRQLGASVAGSTAGEIVVRASVKNSGSRAQPLPLLRVTLQDRFGNRIAARDVPPGDYLPSRVAPGSLLAAGSRVDATMAFVDPGPQAVGFEIDACLRQRNGEVACAHGP